MLRKSFKKSRARNIKLKRIVWRANIKRIAIDEVKIWKHMVIHGSVNLNSIKNFVSIV